MSCSGRLNYISKCTLKETYTQVKKQLFLKIIYLHIPQHLPSLWDGSGMGLKNPRIHSTKLTMRIDHIHKRTSINQILERITKVRRIHRT